MESSEIYQITITPYNFESPKFKFPLDAATLRFSKVITTHIITHIKRKYLKLTFDLFLCKTIFVAKKYMHMRSRILRDKLKSRRVFEEPSTILTRVMEISLYCQERALVNSVLVLATGELLERVSASDSDGLQAGEVTFEVVGDGLYKIISLVTKDCVNETRYTL